MEVTSRNFDYVDDIEDVVEWHKDHAAINFPDSKYKPELFRDSIQAEFKNDFAKLWMAVKGKQKIGWLWVAISYDVYKELSYCEIRYIHLLEEARGQGLGQQLLTMAEAWAREKECTEMRLGTFAGNFGSITTYVKAGYHVKRVLMEKPI